jgi:hypothetical protein
MRLIYMGRRMDQPQLNPGKALRTLATAGIVVCGILIFALITSRTDYISYWSAGKLLLHRSDPYSPSGAFALEKAQGFTRGFMVMLNPPWALFLAAPLGFGGIRVGLFLWTLASVGCIFISAQLINVPSKERAFAYVFAPAVAAVFMGQSSPFTLLGFALFLRLHQTRPFLAGASLLLMAIKPHLFLIFWVALLIDCIYRRRFLLVAGCATALAGGSLFPMLFDPHVWPHYLAMLRGSTLKHQVFPNISMLFRVVIDAQAFWLLFVPSALAAIWALWYYASRRQVWDWRIHGMLLMLISVIVSPYGWLTDEAVLMPSILFALTLPEKRKDTVWILLALNTVVLFIALGHQASLTSRAYIWTPWAWLAWFLYATRGFSGHWQYPPIAQVAEIQKAQV